jgi:rhodanese-related sulfurtransferase
MRMTVRQLPACALLVPAVAVAQSVGSQPSPHATTAESTIRRLAIVAPMPSYPEEALRRHAIGVAVIAATFDVAGKPASLSVLQAPGPAIAEAVRSALEGWTIRPLTTGPDGPPTPVGARLTFYFEIANGKGRVRNPDEMPGGPAWNMSSTPARGGSAPARGAPPLALGGAPLPEIGETQLARLSGAVRVTILDVRERDEFSHQHRAGAVNIPLAELQVRAGIELDRARTIVVDCSDSPSWFRTAGLILTRLGFAHAALYIP